jgi:hypothetical protein
MRLQKPISLKGLHGRRGLSSDLIRLTWNCPQRIGDRGLLIYYSDYHCSHSIAMSADRWPDDVRPSDIEPRFTCEACGQTGADVHPDWNSIDAYA